MMMTTMMLMMMMTVTKTTDFSPKKQVIRLNLEIHLGMKLYDSGIYFVFLTKSVPSAPASQRELYAHLMCLYI